MKRCAAALLVLAVTAAPLGMPRPAGAAVELKFYYPVGVSGPLARVVEAMVSDFNGIHPGIHMTPIFSGGYYETMTKTQTAVMVGAPPDVAVLLSTDLFTLLDPNAIIPLDAFIRESGGEQFRNDFFEAFWLDQFPQALTARDQLRCAQAELSTHNGGDIQNMCSNDLQAALTGRKTPGAALRDAQQQADPLLSRYRKK